jgi:hypothetical protein
MLILEIGRSVLLLILLKNNLKQNSYIFIKMSGIIDSIIERFTGLFSKEKIEVEGYIMLKDSTTNKTQLLVKEGEKSWKTKWFNDNQYTYKAPTVPITDIFIKNM